MKPSMTESAVAHQVASAQILSSPAVAPCPTDLTEHFQPETGIFDPETEVIRLCEVGQLMLAVQRFLAALDQFEQALAIDPHAVDSWCHRADALACLNRYEEALASLDQAQELAGFGVASIWVQKAVVLILLGRFEAALHCCNRAIRLAGNHSQAWLFRGVALHCAGDYAEAAQSYCKAADQPPSALHQNLRRFYHDIAAHGQAS